MKSNLLKLPLAAALLGFLLLGFSNCDKIAEALNLEAPFSTNFIINVTENDELLYMSEELIDLSSNQDFEDNKDKLDNFVLTEMYYEVVDYTGEPGILGSGSTTFYNGSSQVGDAITQSDVDFYSLLESGEKVNLPITDATKNAVQNTLQNEMKITIKIEGLVTDKPVYINLKVTLKISAKVNP
jgi:hypothetical protein